MINFQAISGGDRVKFDETIMMSALYQFNTLTLMCMVLYYWNTRSG